MLGAIIGDTIGSIYEFNNIHTKEFQLFGKASTFTDDSIMSMAVAANLGLFGAQYTQDHWSPAFGLTASSVEMYFDYRF